MYFKAVATFALAFLSVGVHASPLVNLAKRDGNNETIAIPGFGNLNATNATALASIGFPINPTQTTGQTIDPTKAISFIQASSSAVASIVGTGTVLDLEAAMVLAQATAAVGTNTQQLSVYIQESSAVPRVVVSSVGGSAITVATGTATGAFQTTFAGIAFTAAPKAK
ncbi:hypothetical protein GSI_05889 [Ganoderma sinense ZZ0214-1]|uniref:Uncharacterized protein n=1 Tax=Ganoderma sinense ZZ0214-1 TaxID=1077348 RepID=A0A2G8SBS1_9APHY|nr:hypothetical protein GSI_05889 [Ganoderma sinense ZZ0214-1]